MTITWIFSENSKSKIKPAIHSQFVALQKNTLILRNPHIKDSIFMGKLYTSSIWILALTIYPKLLSPEYWHSQNFEQGLFFRHLIIPYLTAPFLIYRVLLIKKSSHFHLNFKTNKIHFQSFKKLYELHWSRIDGGIIARTEFGGVSLSTSYGLACAARREDGSLPQKPDFWIDSNEPADPDLRHVAEVWEYIRQFMEHGPDRLPPPAEPSWLHAPLHKVYLTPAEAWRHYAPWRTGEPGEMQGKKNWMLPIWLVLFPYNLVTAVCWYGICRLFRVRHPVPPLELLEVKR